MMLYFALYFFARDHPSRSPVLKRSHRRFYALEWVSNVSFVLGAVLPAIFAAINILKLSHFWIR